VPADAFYEPLGGGVFRSTEHTVGPWAATDQHAGPPAALLVRGIEAVVPADGRLARITVDLLRGVPVADLEVRARVVRPGRSVQLAEAELLADGRPVARMTAWWHQVTDTGAVAGPAVPAPPLPDRAMTAVPPWTGWGYVDAVEWRRVVGGFDGPGPATVWARLRHPLVSGEQPTGLQRLLAVADSGNGVSWELDVSRWLFVNTDLTVHVLRPPTGEWICLDAVTRVGADGSGVATSRLSDQDGAVAFGAQALLVRPRG
jgi:hypothetical protein